jgi:hypothetical protein
MNLMAREESMSNSRTAAPRNETIACNESLKIDESSILGPSGRLKSPGTFKIRAEPPKSPLHGFRKGIYDSGQKNISPQPFAAQNRAIIHPKKNLFLKRAKDRSSQPKPNPNPPTNTVPHSPKRTKPPQTPPPTQPNFTKLTNPTPNPTLNPTKDPNPNQTYTTFTKDFYSKICNTPNVPIPKK